jgi:hypothetical protein
VWATGACEVIQDSNFVSVQQYSRRTLCVSEGIQETICVPIFLRTRAGSEGLAAAGEAPGPVGVLEVVLASSLHAANGSQLAIQGRVRLSAGGTAAVITSIGSALDAAGLSCCADEEHHGYAVAPAQQAPPESPRAAAVAAAEDGSGRRVTPRSSLDAACTAAGMALPIPIPIPAASPSAGVPRSSGSMARISSCRSFHGSALIAPHVRP